MGTGPDLAPGWKWEHEDRAWSSRRQSFSARDKQQNSFQLGEESSPGALTAQLRLSLKNLNPNNLAELAALGEERNGEMFFSGLLNFGQRLQDQGKAEAAAEVYAAILHRLPDGGVRQSAEARLNALLGTGNAGLRAEVLLRNFAQSATSYQTIVPMIAGSAVYQVTRVSTLGRLGSSARATWFTRGFGARLTAATAGMALEVPVFSLGRRGLMALGGENFLWDGVSVGKDLLGATITLGALKIFGHVGNQAVHKVRARGAIRELPLQFIPQAAMFSGLMAAHRLEEGVGLRPHVDGATAATDALATMVSLGVGSHLGKRILGGNFSRFQSELELRARHQSPSSENFSSLQRTPIFSAVGTRSANDSWRMPRGGESPRDPNKNPNVLMSTNNDEGGGKGPIDELFRSAKAGKEADVVKLAKLAEKDLGALDRLLELARTRDNVMAVDLARDLDVKAHGVDLEKMPLGMLPRLQAMIALENRSAFHILLRAAIAPGIREEVQLLSIRHLGKAAHDKRRVVVEFLEAQDADELYSRALHSANLDGSVLLFLLADSNHVSALKYLAMAAKRNEFAARLLRELRPEHLAAAQALQGEPNLRLIPQEEPGGLTANRTASTQRGNTIQELVRIARKSVGEPLEEALTVLALMARANLAPGWALYELATSGPSTTQQAAQKIVLALPLNELRLKAGRSEETRNFLYSVGNMGHPEAFPLLMEAALEAASREAWAIWQLKDLGDKDHPGAPEALRNLEVEHWAELAKKPEEVGAPAILRLLAENSNGNALVALYQAAKSNTAAKTQLEWLAAHDVQVILSLSQWLPADEGMGEFLRELQRKGVHIPASTGAEAESTAAQSIRSGTTLPPVLFKVLPRGGVMVKTSAGWIQFGVPRWTNKDAFELFAAQGGFANPKEAVPELIPTIYFFDPDYVSESDGLLPADFIQYMHFVSKGTTFKLVAPDAETAYRLKSFLDVSYQGLQDPALSERVLREYLMAPYGTPNLATEMKRGFPAAPPEALRQVSSLDEAGYYGDLNFDVIKVAPLVYEIRDGGKNLGRVDLRQHPVPQPSLSRDPNAARDPALQRLREIVLIEKRPALWPIGTGHGFTPKEETSGFMIWNEGKVILVDPPSITLEYLIANGLPLEKVHGILLTHGHTDHHGPAVPMLLRMLPKVKLYTTPEIKRMLQMQYELAIGNHGEGLEQWNFVPIYPQQFTDIIGLHIRADYSFHTVPSLGFEIYDRPDIKAGRLVVSFTGDSFADYEGIWKHTRPGAGDESPVLTEERAFSVTRHMALLLASKWQSPPPVMLIEGGIAPIHIDPGKTQKFLEFAEKMIGVDTSRVRVYHVGEEAAAKAGVAKWPAGHKGHFDLSEYFPHFKPGHLQNYVLEVLQGQPMLAGLAPETFLKLFKQGELEKVAAGETIIREGALEDNVYVLIDGEAQIVKGQERIALRPSGLLGEGALFGEPRNASVVTTVPSLFLKLNGQAMARTLQGSEMLGQLEHIRAIRAQAYEAVLKSPLGHLPDSILDLVFSRSEVKYLQPGQTLLTEGEQGGDVFIILSGDARVSNAEKTIHLIPPAGTMLGEMALVHNAPRSATVTAVNPLKVLRVPAEGLKHLMEEYPGIGIALRRTAQSRKKSNGAL